MLVSSLAAGAARDLVRSRSELVAENALLRQQLIVLSRSVAHPRIGDRDRMIMLLLARLNPAWSQGLHIVKPDTLLRWHRRPFPRLQEDRVGSHDGDFEAGRQV